MDSDQWIIDINFFENSSVFSLSAINTLITAAWINDS